MANECGNDDKLENTVISCNEEGLTNMAIRTNRQEFSTPRVMVQFVTENVHLLLQKFK